MSLFSRPESGALKVVLDGANILFHRGGHERDWRALETAAIKFHARGVTPVIVMKEAHFKEIPPGMMFLKQNSICAPQRPRGWSEGEEDDFAVAEISHHLFCPLVSNDTFMSWLGIAPLTLRLWVERLSAWSGHISFVFIDDEFVPMPEYPFQKAESIRAQMKSSLPVTNIAKPTPKSVRFRLTALNKTSNSPLQEVLKDSIVTVSSSSTLHDLLSDLKKGIVHLKGPRESWFFYTDDGQPLEANESQVADAFAGKDNHEVFIGVAGDFEFRPTAIGKVVTPVHFFRSFFIECESARVDR